MCSHEQAILKNDGSIECVACGHITTVQRIELENNLKELLAIPSSTQDIDWDKEFEERFLGLTNE